MTDLAPTHPCATPPITSTPIKFIVENRISETGLTFFRNVQTNAAYESI